MTKYLAVIALIILTGCASTPEQKVQTAADVAQFCAYNASEALLIKQPQAEPALRLVANDLRALETVEHVSMTDILLVIGRLPADKLQSPIGRIAIVNGTMLLVRLGRSSDLASVDLKPIVTGLREGIEMRIGPPPILVSPPPAPVFHPVP